MKKLILLTILALTSLNCFSQTGTNKESDTTKVVLTKEVAKQVVKDLIRLDGCQEELKLTQDKVIKLEEREIQKDTIISLLKDKDKNNQFIITQKDKQLQISDELSKSLEKELKSSKRTTFLYKLGTVVGILSTSFLLITK
jgi:hypothetical protein